MTWMRLKNACLDSGQYGYNIPAHEYVDRGVRLVRTTDLATGSLGPHEDGIFVPEPVPASSRLHADDLLVSRSGTIGRAFLVPAEAEGMTFAGFLVRFRHRPSIVDPRYLYYSTQSQTFQSQVRADAIISTIQNFNADRYANVTVWCPPLDVQRRVANFLDDEVSRIDEAVRLRGEQVRTLNGLLAAKAHALVTGSEHDDLGITTLPWSRTLPREWSAVGLSTIARLGTGHTPSRSVAAYWENCDIPWLTTSDVHRFRKDEIESIEATENRISAVGLANSAAVLHPAGTVALSRTASAGFSIVMDVSMATSQDFAVWRPSPRLVPGYLLWCLRAMRSDLMGRLAMGSTHKTIYFPDLEMIQIPLPPVAVQAEIADEMSAVAHLINELRAEMSAQTAIIEDRKRALITAAVTGEFDVTTASGRGV